MLNFNISFDGHGWNIKYRVYPDSENSGQVTLELSIPDLGISSSVVLDLPQPPHFQLFCQIIENDEYSAKVRNNGQCLPYVEQINITENNDVNFKGITCFNQSIEENFSSTAIQKPVLKIVPTTQQNNALDERAMVIGNFALVRDLEI